MKFDGFSDILDSDFPAVRECQLSTKDVGFPQLSE
jgi:hypothetical protein